MSFENMNTRRKTSLIIYNSFTVGSQPPQESLWYNLKPALVGRGKIEMEERGWTLQTGRWQYSEQGNLQGLSWGSESRVHFHTHLPNPKTLYRGFNWGQLCTLSWGSQHHFPISRLCLCGSFQEQGRQAEHIFQGQERWWGAFHFLGSSNNLLMTSSDTPPIVTSSYSLTGFPFFWQCPLSNQKGLC